MPKLSQADLDKKLFDAIEVNDISEIRSALADGADVNAKTYYDRTPLHLAQTDEQTKLFIEKGGELDAVDQDGQTPLFRARTAGQTKLLIEAGAEVNIVNNDYFSALHMGNKEQIALLKEAGATSPGHVFDNKYHPITARLEEFDGKSYDEQRKMIETIDNLLPMIYDLPGRNMAEKLAGKTLADLVEMNRQGPQEVPVIVDLKTVDIEGKSKGAELDDRKVGHGE